MRVWWFLYLTVTATLFVGSISKYDDFHDDDDVDDEDVDDGIVEVEAEEPVVQRERPEYVRPVPVSSTFFYEPFDTRAEFLKRWVVSQAKKDGVEENLAKYDGKWIVEEPRESPIRGDLGLIMKSKAKHHAIASKLEKPYEFAGKPFIAQYEVKFQNGLDCGGAYIKLLSKVDKFNLKSFTDKTPYTIMFGPDKCGNDHKLHFIFRHKNPKTGVYEEKHAEKPSGKLENYFTDRKTHLYTLIVNPDNTYEMKVDNAMVTSGSLLENVSPPVNPPEEIEDPKDKKPADWDDREKIPDPDATKPDDWDETEPATIIDEDAVMPDGWLEDEEVYIPDPTAVKPEDWDDEMDGEWEAPRIDNPKCADAPGCGKWERPTINNPKYKGVWRAPSIDNPNYKGEWKPKRIPNPDYFEDKEPYKMTPIEAVGLELWSMTDEILFDNFIISDNETVVEEFTAITWEVKNMEERAAASTGQSIIQAIKDATNERPWLWAVFILVVVLPIVLIITCCCTSSPKVKWLRVELPSRQGLFSYVVSAALVFLSVASLGCIWRTAVVLIFVRDIGWWQAIKSSTEERPWLWAVYAMVLLLPIILLSICLCPKSGPVKPEDIDAHKKKFDDPSPDVIEEEEEPAEGEEEQEAEEETEGDDTEKGAGDGGTKTGDEDDDAEEETGDVPKKPNSPRKRKVRKE